MNTSEVLNRAADLIEERGWERGGGWPGAEKDVTALCLEGGVMAALGLEYRDLDRFTRCAAHQALRTYLGTPFPFIWNDTAGRTAAEVIEVLRAAALIEAAREDQDDAWQSCAQNLAVTS